MCMTQSETWKHKHNNELSDFSKYSHVIATWKLIQIKVSIKKMHKWFVDEWCNEKGGIWN